MPNPQKTQVFCTFLYIFLQNFLDQLFFKIKLHVLINSYFLVVIKKNNKYKKNIGFVDKIMKKVGEHVTIDFLGVKQDYSPDFYSKVIYKIAKKG